MDPVLLLTTTAKEDEAKKIAQGLVAEQMAACVNIVGPITSVYKWEGKVVTDQEYKLFIKTRRSAKEKIFTYIKDRHSYSVPELSLIEIKEMESDYLEWIQNTVL